MSASYRSFFVGSYCQLLDYKVGFVFFGYRFLMSVHRERRVFRRLRIVRLWSGVVPIHAYRFWLRIVRFSLFHKYCQLLHYKVGFVFFGYRCLMSVQKERTVFRRLRIVRLSSGVASIHAYA